MYVQPKQKSESPSNLFSDNAASRTPPSDSIAASSGELAGSSGGVNSEQQTEIDMALRAQTQPYRITAQLLERGRERYGIYCEPCHSPVGDGDGYITRRGFPHPPTYHSERLRAVSDRYIFDVIGNGYGLMYGYGNRIEAPDRWRIIAYVRALQLSRHAVVAELPPDIRRALTERAQ
jgi:mono/diheme cytochrome c family protein